MQNKKTILFIALILAVVSAQQIAFDLKSVKYSQASDFWTVEVPCIGGSGQYSYEFDLPTGWKSEGNLIKIPSASTTQVNNQYAVRCRVKDSVKGDLLERSLVFKPFSQGNSYSLQITDKQYFYGSSNLSSYSQQSSEVHGIDVLNRLGSLVQNVGAINLGVSNVGYSNNNAGAYYGAGSAGSYGASAGSYNAAGYNGAASYGAGSYGAGSYGNAGSLGVNAGLLGVNTGLNLNLGGIGANVNYGNGYSNSYGSQSAGSYGGSYTQQQQQSSSSSSSSSSSGSSSSSSSSSTISYSSLPSITQLQKYVAGGDIVEIIQIIQLVVDSNIRCDAKASYLSDFLGRISAAIQVKKYTLTQLKAVVSTAIAQVQKLTVQIQTIKGQQADLKIDELKKQLDSLVLQLKAAYEEYNNFSVNSTSFESEVVTLEKEMNQITIKFTEVQKQLDLCRQTVKSIDLEISDYEERIRKLKEKKVTIQNDIVSGENFIKEKTIRITQIKQRITVIKTQISTISVKKESLKKAYLELEAKVDSVKIAYQSASDKFVQFDQQIVSITVEIERYQKQTSELQVKQVSQCVENLQSAIKEIKSSIDFVQYRCYNAPDIKVTTQCYQIPQTQWFNYIGQYYTNLADQIRMKVAQSFQNQVIEISSINIFSDSWKQNYGSCFEKDIASKAQNYKTDKTFGFDSDFSCSNEFSKVESKNGVIQSINANSVVVKGDDGNNYTLRLGSCSRFEGQGKDFIPKVGNNILWKGSKTTSSYNMHSCTCY